MLSKESRERQKYRYLVESISNLLSNFEEDPSFLDLYRNEIDEHFKDNSGKEWSNG